MAETYWLTADYFDSFKCKCGSCRHTCCGGWRIAVGEKVDAIAEVYHVVEHTAFYYNAVVLLEK